MEHRQVVLRPGRPGCLKGIADRATCWDHEETSKKLSALPSTSTWLVRHATVKPPHANDI